MNLTDYLAPLNLQYGGEDFSVASVENDSRLVRKGSLFCAIAGAKTDGNRFVQDALAKGASAVLSEEPLSLPVPVFQVPDAYRAWGILCETEAGFPAGDLRLHGVTGTNGKTTIAFLIHHFLKHAFPEKKTGLISTIRFDCGDGKTPDSPRTTPDAKNFQTILSSMRKNGCSDCVMELSSHGLYQHRTGNARYSGAVFTNLTGDHLDYHRTMENYFLAKRILFRELCTPEGVRIINVDDPWGRRLAEECSGNVQTLSLRGEKASIRVSRVLLRPDGSSFTLDLDGTVLELNIGLIGLHNVYNFAEAAAEAFWSGVPADSILRTAALPFAVPGRLEKIPLPTGAVAFVDYAHTDDALERVLSALKALPHRKLLCVFGCGGDRDRTKRPRMGKAAASLADRLFVTSDNPRTEDPEQIIREILPGIPKETSVLVRTDREEAIRQAVLESGDGDILLVAGKGHENYQEINGIRHPFDDREILRKINQPQQEK